MAVSRAIDAAASKGRARPRCLAEARFTEWTPDRRLRHTVFLGLREDKPGRDVVLDPAIGTALPPREPA
jgi:bifunctional non-homologous end joining protein LigD